MKLKTITCTLALATSLVAFPARSADFSDDHNLVALFGDLLSTTIVLLKPVTASNQFVACMRAATSDEYFLRSLIQASSGTLNRQQEEYAAAFVDYLNSSESAGFKRELNQVSQKFAEGGRTKQQFGRAIDVVVNKYLLRHPSEVKGLKALSDGMNSGASTILIKEQLPELVKHTPECQNLGNR
ncbi:MAG: hypothetical protein ACRCV6_04755 [Formosimonas sp.]